MKAITAEITGLMTGAGVPCLLHETDEHGPHAVWYNQQGGDRNWIIINLKNVGTTAVSSLKLRLAYAASGEACAPKSAKGDKPLLVQQSEPSELAALSLARGAAHATSVRISDLSGAHQKRRFVVEILGGAEVIGTTKPIEVRARHPTSAARSRGRGGGGGRPRRARSRGQRSGGRRGATGAAGVSGGELAVQRREAVMTLLRMLPLEQQRAVRDELNSLELDAAPARTSNTLARSRLQKLVNTVRAVNTMKRSTRGGRSRTNSLSINEEELLELVGGMNDAFFDEILGPGDS